jgi:ABC-type nitrate/sulfonate/bicarbonate transport system permease component
VTEPSRHRRRRAALPGSPDRRPARTTSRGAHPALVGTASVATALLAWQILAEGARPAFGATPLAVLRAGRALLASGELAPHALATAHALGAGFSLALLVGLPLGVAMGRLPWLRHLLDPVVMAGHATPRIALLPVLILWLGIGVASKAAAAFLGAVFPVIVNTLAGVRQLDALWERTVRAFGGSRRAVVAKVVLPGALPAVMGGLRLGFGRALIGVIVGEMYVSVAGIGQLLVAYGQAGRTAEMLALAGLVGGVSLAAIVACRVAERRLGPWRAERDA